MKFLIQVMTENLAREILTWRYETPYDLYNQDANEEGLAEFLNGSYQVILDSAGQLIGFYCTGQSAQVPKGHEFNAYQNDYLDFGLGLKPELTGQGNGGAFLDFILQQLAEDRLRLTVASFNKRAIRLYESFGFEQVACFSNGQVEFIIMTRKRGNKK